jgi:hypothetical protein
MRPILNHALLVLLLLCLFAMPFETSSADDSSFLVTKEIATKVAEALWPERGDSVSVVVHVLSAFRGRNEYCPHGRPSLEEMERLLLDGRVGREWYPDFNMIHRTRYGAAYFVDEKFGPSGFTVGRGLDRRSKRR